MRQTASEDLSRPYDVILRRQTFARAYRMRTFYVLLSLSFSLLVLFNYVPIYGALIAFKNVNVVQGIRGSPWNDFAYSKRITNDSFFLRVLWNTFWLSVLRIVFAFPAPIILALLLNELRSVFYKRAVQTVSYLPHFMSWVVLGGIVKEVLSPSRGAIGFVFQAVGLEPATAKVDRFVEQRAGDRPGYLLTREFVLEGNRLRLNTAMPQKPWHEQLVRVEIARHPPLGRHYGSSQPYPGFSLDDSDELRGTRTDMPVTWNGSPDLSALVGKPVYLRFEIINMGLFSFKVAQE